MKNKYLFLNLINLILSISLTNCSQNKEPEVNKDPIEQVKEVRNSPIPDDCDNFEYKAVYKDGYKDEGEIDIIYLGNFTCPYWENKYDEYLNEKYVEKTIEEKLDYITLKMKLEPYVKKIYGFSTLEEAKEDYIKWGNKSTKSYREMSKKLKAFKKKMEDNNEISNWTLSDKKNFKVDCLRGLLVANSKFNMAGKNEYCDCVLEKIMVEFPDKYSQQDIIRLKKISKECIEGLINK